MVGTDLWLLFGLAVTKGGSGAKQAPQLLYLRQHRGSNGNLVSSRSFSCSAVSRLPGLGYGQLGAKERKIPQSAQRDIAQTL